VSDLIGNGKKHLIPLWQPANTGDHKEGKKIDKKTQPPAFRTKHNGTLKNV